MTDTGTIPATLAADELPVPFGIEAETGAPLAGLTETDLQRIVADGRDVRDRSSTGTKERIDVDLLSRCTMHAKPDGSPEFTICEMPLRVWHDIPGSKVRPSDALCALLDLTSLYRRRRHRHAVAFERQLASAVDILRNAWTAASTT